MSVHLRRLSPVDFLERSARIYRRKTAVVDGATRRTYPDMLDRVYRFAHLLHALGVRAGERVAVLAKNESTLLEAHFAVPLAGGVLCALNIRLIAGEIAYIVEHCGAGVVVYDPEFAHLVDGLDPRVRRVRTGSEEGDLDALLAGSPAEPIENPLTDDDTLISINYTSGTTGRPKGVMYTHRGAYLNALAEVDTANLRAESVYLWTLPMFHCNGWCYPWAVTAAGARHVCLPKVEPATVFDLIEREGVTHFCGAPTVLIGIANYPKARAFPQAVHVITAGAPPAPTTIAQIEELGATVTQVYGLTETYGPITVSAWQSEWNDLSATERAKLKARQGVGLITVGADDVRVTEQLAPDAPLDAVLRDVPADGRTLGEVVMRGNNVMKGYYRDPDATARAFTGGYFHSGDIAVMHPDGYLEIADRAKDVIISGGENISTVQIEKVILEHPHVLECAVVAKPDETWGEVPKAFVFLKSGCELDAEELIAHCRERLPHFKAPKEVEFGELPKTSTGKIQKFVLREKEWSGLQKRVH